MGNRYNNILPSGENFIAMESYKLLIICFITFESLNTCETILSSKTTFISCLS